ncbi:hypothetical protein [Nonomuraea sp. NEAU-A123]|uniref:hypothetical protein n=1 Tax=Nonomuraea sp. NEAU-A123 TaxID=2839649 RepID=UPI001BE46480|nr:hypothetical protein [Nonomuraea sp. NEAU-A123]MBT2235566.1 hypothetical protein [Nonomuraea sp. NEAU-A123]
MAPVPNPRHAELQRLIAQARAHVDRLETALDPACNQFGGQAIWVGRTAQGFARELTGHRARVRAVARAVLETLEEEMRRTPSEVSPGEAKNP